MNIKEYLVKKKGVDEKVAKALVENEFVFVNGRKITDITIPVDERDEIIILDENKTKYPESYWILRKIQNELNLIEKGDFVIDVESRDGGFPLFIEDIGNVLVLTKGNPLLETYDFTVKQYNPRDIGEITSEKADILINELEIDLIHSFQILNDLLKFVKSEGKVLIHLPTKNRKRDEVQRIASEFLDKLRLDKKKIISADKKLYAFAKKF